MSQHLNQALWQRCQAKARELVSRYYAEAADMGMVQNAIPIIGIMFDEVFKDGNLVQFQVQEHADHKPKGYYGCYLFSPKGVECQVVSVPTEPERLREKLQDAFAELLLSYARSKK